jgi:hypothetical protein
VQEVLVLPEDVEERAGVHAGVEVPAPLLEGGHGRVEVGQPGGEELLAGFREQLREVPAAGGIGREGFGDDVHVEWLFRRPRFRISRNADRRLPPVRYKATILAEVWEA